MCITDVVPSVRFFDDVMCHASDRVVCSDVLPNCIKK